MPVFNLITLFPEFFTSPLNASLIARARKSGILRFNLVNPRDFSIRKHSHVDDKPFGGGSGMVMDIAPLCAAIRSLNDPGHIILLTPSGKPLTHHGARKLAGENALTLICGRYEGIDARISELYDVDEFSIGQTVLNGGETAALAVIESVCRFIPGFLGKKESAMEESFSNGILEYPQYTRPENFEGVLVPPVLLGGNHQQIAKWRRLKALEATLKNQPWLLNNAPLTKNDAELLAHIPRARTGRNLAFCLVHYPVLLEGRQSGISSLTNLDIHDIARISQSYGLGPFFVLTPLRDQLELLNGILRHWLGGKQREHSDRRRALMNVHPVESLAELQTQAFAYYGMNPEFILTSAAWPGKRKEILSCADVQRMCMTKPVIILLGTGRGLDLKKFPEDLPQLRPLCFLGDNHLSVRSAAAIMADRILGDFS